LIISVLPLIGADRGRRNAVVGPNVWLAARQKTAHQYPLS
jgi:hypothetical protein